MKKGLKASELGNCTEQELTLKERNLREGLHKERFKKYTGQLSDTASLRRMKRDLARVLTIARARQIETEKKV
jgi:large subunit ribosomal protein L29